jgi:hypothetical protein
MGCFTRCWNRAGISIPRFSSPVKSLSPIILDFASWGGIVVGMFLYVIFRNPKVFLASSAVLLVVFNVFVIARQLGGAMVLVGHAEGLFGGTIASLVLLRLDQRQDQQLNAESPMAPTTAEKKP